MSNKTVKIDNLNTQADRKELKKQASRKQRHAAKKNPEEAPKKKAYIG